MSQSLAVSAVEAAVNTVVGLGVSYAFTLYALPWLFGIEIDPVQAGWITVSYFILSFLRGWVVRRVFNRF